MGSISGDDEMKATTIAFDIDGTLIATGGTPNLNVFNMLMLLARCKNTRIIVWSGGGKDYAESIVNKYGLSKYVHATYSKTGCTEIVDIAFDDQHEFAMATSNIIVREK